MSLTAHILLGHETQLPQGRMREHLIDPPRSSFGGDHTAPSRNVEIQNQNIELVYNAVKYGIGKADDICDLTNLSKNTVLRALNSLYTWPGGPRATYTRERHGPGRAYIWKVMK